MESANSDEGEMNFFPHDRRRSLDTRLAEMILGLMAVSYGINAIHFPNSDFIMSQFQTLLLLEGGGSLIGTLLCLSGAFTALLSWSRFRMWRFWAQVSMVPMWMIMIWLFLRQKELGLPLTNSVIAVAAAFVICGTLLFNEKHSQSGYTV